MRPITTNDAPQPAGHYSQAILHAGILYVSGQLPIDPATGERVVGSVEAETRQALANLGAVVRAAGGELSDVVKVTVYISDIGLWGKVNGVYAEFFGPHRPARSVVPTRELHFGFQIEIDAMVAVGNPAQS